ncbi:beta-mannosidase [Psychroserpens sp. Hel_I_66]|uniref:beta-mannosidase n=1 Tax=Psychroserpens sp. Hel_I_66 TaxID=1250004 RepID=UPI001E405447|nr:glycoside hydrolase family 2 protein [Psychroserpens sp. Hel_I_66]
MSCKPKHDLPISIDLHDNWQFKAVNDSIWQSATVPGNVHSDLLENELIKHPFIGANEDSLQWISETDWEYRTQFSVDKNILLKKHIELNFEGLDTYASVFLNDRLILETNNAFREFTVDVTKNLKLKNELRIVFERTSISEEKEKAKLSYQLPEGNRIFTRKAQFQYGWDWGPKLNTSGIWRPVTISAWNDFKIKDTFIKINEISTDNAELSFEIDFKLGIENILTFDTYVGDSLYKSITYFPPKNKKIALPINNINTDFLPIDHIKIKNPKLWWPHNLGEPYLYAFKVVVRDDKTILDSISIKKGLRTVELVTEKDSIGESFYFKVNNVPVYAKGANYIPQNSMQNQVTDAHYENLLNNVVDANMNMLRVWGGGIYENDIFYDLCDEKGILVWQDFMFACALYPGDDAFLENIKTEALQNVKRLRNHASIALWCGNNENSEGWHRWGWQAGRSDEEKDEIWDNYLKVFDSILPAIVSNYSNTSYWQSSPKYGRGNPKYKTEGDAHDWWIWHDGYPFKHLEENVPRFMSEFGFQSFPGYETIRYINHSDSIEISSEGFKNHQKHGRGFQIIDNYMKRDFPVPTNPEDYVYVSQLLQAHGITTGIEANRRAKPYNMGTLYWQLNDCWPAVSWSSLDYFGNWKALHYQAKKSFENVLLSSEIENNTLKTHIINDSLSNINNELKLKIIDFKGTELWSDQKAVSILGNSNDIVHQLNLSTLSFDSSQTVFISEIGNHTSYFYFEKPKHLKLEKASIEKTITKTNNGFKITIKSTTLQKNVFMFSKSKGHFSDNFFDLMPNTEIEIEFKTDADNLKDLRIKTLNDLI